MALDDVLDTVIHADCRDVLKTLPDACCDAVVTDPPYALTQVSRGGSPRYNDPTKPYGRHRLADKGFLGQQWDNGKVAHDPAFWAEVLRVAKPGVFLLSFAGTRTYHRLACAVEDAGWECRDMINWIFGNGFPKSKSCLKPSHEPILLAKAPGPLQPLHIDACRVAGTPEPTRFDPAKHSHDGWRMTDSGADTAERAATAGGRWPPNVVLSEGVAVDELDRQAAPSKSRKGQPRTGRNGNGWGMTATGAEYDDAGGPSRFFPTFAPDPEDAVPFRYQSKASRRDRGEGNTHPTCKSTALMEWLCTLVTPPKGVILDPFAGSGSTAVGALKADRGFRFILIEQDEEYVRIARQRIAAAYVSRETSRRTLNGRH